MVRTEFGRFGRQVSGYSLEHLLPEKGVDLARFLVGSEGTLAVVTEATVRLVTDPPEKTLVVLGFDDIYAAGDVAPLMKQLGAVASEGIDRRIVDVVRARLGDNAVPDLPEGNAWLAERLAAPLGERLLAGRVALLLGSEGHGLSERWQEAADVRAVVPMRAGVDSLNVAAAAAVACYVTVRR